MYDTIDRFVEAGHFSSVSVAGRYAALRAMTIRFGCESLGFTLAKKNDPTEELFLRIRDLNDADELDAVAEYIEAEFADDYDDERDSADFWNTGEAA
jgi:hypothetical protein